MIILQRMMFWAALKLLGLSTRKVDDTYFPVARSTKKTTLRVKSIPKIGGQTAIVDVGGSTLPKPFPNSAVLKGFGPHLDGKKVNLK